MLDDQINFFIEKRKDKKIKTYIFEVNLKREEDGYWCAQINVMPECRITGSTKELALDGLEYVVKEYLAVLIERGQDLRFDGGIEMMDSPAIAVML